MATPPPVLASDALREELAPREPARRALRICNAGIAVGFLAVGICLKAGLGLPGGSPDPSSACLGAAVVIGGTALAPLPYLWRAIVDALVGFVLIALGLDGEGPLALLALPGVSSGSVEAFRLLAATALPAALLFRAHYRAYAGGRLLLGAALVLTIPFLIHAGGVALDGPGILARVGAGVALGAVLCGLFAFLEAPTTSITGWWAELLVISVALDVGLRQVYLPPAEGLGPFAHVLTAVTLVLVASPISLGLFQILSACYGPAARCVNIHARPKEKEYRSPKD